MDAFIAAVKTQVHTPSTSTHGRLHCAVMNVDPQKPNAAAVELSYVASRQSMATAYHEAGHAVMAVSLGRLIQKVTILPGKSQFGVVRQGVCELRKGRSKSSKDPLEDEALILLAGMVAEARFTGQYCPQGAAQDLRDFRRLVQNRVSNKNQLDRLQRRLLDKAEHLLGDAPYAKAIEWIANELIQKSTISGRAVRHLFEQADQQSD